MLRPGDAAPDFVLKDQDGNDLRLSSHSGAPIVLTFLQCAVPGSGMLAKGLRDRTPDIAAHGGVVVAVGLAPPETHAAFRDAHGLPFSLVSDTEGHVHDLYEAWRTTLLGRAPWAVRRCAYLIDGDGIIHRTYAAVNVLTHARQIVKDLDRLQAQDAWGKRPLVRLRPPKET